MLTFKSSNILDAPLRPLTFGIGSVGSGGAEDVSLVEDEENEDGDEEKARRDEDREESVEGR